VAGHIEEVGALQVQVAVQVAGFYGAGVDFCTNAGLGKVVHSGAVQLQREGAEQAPHIGYQEVLDAEPQGAMGGVCYPSDVDMAFGFAQI
jgi:hypothetical protein